MKRRDFLKQASCASVGTLGVASAVAQLQLMSSLVEAQSNEDYKAIVCVFLAGGNDGNNMIIPTTPSLYDRYATGRSVLTINRNSLQPLNFPDSSGITYGLHPNMPGLRSIFNQGKAAFIFNTGMLIAPTTKDDYLKKRVPLPHQLFAHNEQAEQWQALEKGTAISISGWGGRMADILTASSSNQAKVQMAISLNPGGGAFFNSGNATTSYTVNPEGIVKFYGLGDAPYGGGSEEEKLRFEFFQRVMSRSRTNLFESTYSKITLNSLSQSRDLADLINSSAITVPFPDSSVGKQLGMAARMISIRSSLGLKRQIFFVSQEGYDTHDEQPNTQSALLSELDAGISAFHTAMERLGLSDKVLLFTTSEFGRTLTFNGKGTDHGWGNDHFIVGGGVRGGKFYGTFPNQTLNGPDDIHGGRWVPKISVDQYAANIGRWFGVSDANLKYVFPNLERFNAVDIGIG
jgi:uncharacterized protein (DUF1501 family)